MIIYITEDDSEQQEDPEMDTSAMDGGGKESGGFDDSVLSKDPGTEQEEKHDPSAMDVPHSSSDTASNSLVKQGGVGPIHEKGSDDDDDQVNNNTMSMLNPSFLLPEGMTTIGDGSFVQQGGEMSHDGSVEDNGDDRSESDASPDVPWTRGMDIEEYEDDDSSSEDEEEKNPSGLSKTKKKKYSGKGNTIMSCFQFLCLC